jgi:hypothetical protein
VSRWLVDKMSSLLEARTDRRGFLSRSALVGSAVAVAPATFVLKPGTAYGAICNCNGSLCNCGSLCCDGYTEFCCTLSGLNRCPPGTLVAGWWKADGSGFCSVGGVPQPRYYVDCNAACGSCPPDASGFCSGACYGCGCGCANGSCSNRKACCTRFRYGQCSQAVAHVGPIVCRVVTCNPPWVWDSTCTTTSATDNATASHHRPCLSQSDPTDTLEPPPPEEPTGPSAAQIYHLVAPEDDTMKLVNRPNSNTWYLLYPSGLLIEVTGNVLSIESGGIERLGGVTNSVFNRLVTVNEKVRSLLGLDPNHISRV